MNVNEHMIMVENALERIASDAESEKETRSRSNAAIHERFNKVDAHNDAMRMVMLKAIWVVGGVIGFLNLIVTVVTLLQFLKQIKP